MIQKNVYFHKGFKNIKKSFLKITKDIWSKENKNVIIKLHFGERGNNTSLQINDIKPYTEILKKLGYKSILTDTPVVYPSVRNTVPKYTKFAIQKGFSNLGEILISDTYKKIKAKAFTVECSKDLLDSKNILVISHIKGHTCSSFGGTIKNLGMGGTSKKSKLAQHDLGKPVLDKTKCIKCNKCIQICPAKTIKTIFKIIHIDNCFYGCSKCILVCPKKALKPKKAIFDDLLAQSASSLINNFSKHTFYINILKNITLRCDCSKNPGNIICKDIGILFSKNPVALDKASIDIINQYEKDIFQHSHQKDPYLQIKFASKYTKLDMEYDLININ